MPLLTNYHFMKMSTDIDQFSHVEKLATLTSSTWNSGDEYRTRFEQPRQISSCSELSWIFLALAVPLPQFTLFTTKHRASQFVTILAYACSPSALHHGRGSRIPAPAPSRRT